MRQLSLASVLPLLFFLAYFLSLRPHLVLPRTSSLSLYVRHLIYACPLSTFNSSNCLTIFLCFMSSFCSYAQTASRIGPCCLLLYLPRPSSSTPQSTIFTLLSSTRLLLALLTLPLTVSHPSFPSRCCLHLSSLTPPRAPPASRLSAFLSCFFLVRRRCFLLTSKLPPPPHPHAPSCSFPSDVKHSFFCSRAFRATSAFPQRFS